MNERAEHRRRLNALSGGRIERLKTAMSALDVERDRAEWDLLFDGLVAASNGAMTLILVEDEIEREARESERSDG